MLKKIGIAVFAAVLGVFTIEAADILQIDFNFYSDGDIVLDGKLPEGVTFGPRRPFRNTKAKGYGFPIIFDVNKVQSIDMKFTVKGKGGRLVPSVIRFSRDPKTGKTQALPVTCKVFEFCDESSSHVPCVISRWKGMMDYRVENGDVLTLKAEFEKPAAK